MQALSARVTLGRPATARVAKKQQRPLTVASAVAQLSAEQKAFLDRKARESRSPAPVETRGRSAPRPRSASPVGRPSSRTPAPASSSSFGYSAPAAANGLSAEQVAFMERKARESRSPAPVETRGRSAPRPRSASPRPTSRTPAAASYSAPAASYSAPAAAASAGGLSAEQREFMERKARESRSPAPVETRGRSAPRPRAASPRPSSRTPAPASYSAPAASYSAPAASYSAPAANGLSAEQAEFLRRKAQETRGSSAPVETRGRSAPRPRSVPARPSSRTPAPASYSAPAAASSSYGYGASSAAPANGLSKEQQEFMARKAQESRSFSAPAPTRGRSSNPRRR
ncbi:cuticle isoform B-like [Chlorella sorokiniana]|uniref:Cuticle isoform B-like n=1 Tax=Chlorella sorokiniana TaxID=3076 RepID=A0A2P6TJU3_CHLSO|nr:cuticle isoform B-like [Chlorella sorokiniana]|eukprot:PRW44308.1 cuticle isoform B-like [Chlorella sorokiniana]